MAVQLGFRPTSVPVERGSRPPRAGARRDFGLEITGTDTSVPDGTAGRVKLVEAQGTGSNAGASESAERLIATFHGTWHRSTGRGAAVTFDVFMASGYSAAAPSPDVHGFDPECMPGLGVDGFAFTFLGRLFAVNFPFFIDSSSEGRFVELQAVAEHDGGGSPTEFARSAVLNIPIRRNHTVETTTNSPAGGVMTYTDNLVGNLVLHHESFLVQGARIRTGASWPATVDPQYFTISPTASGAFQRYTGLSGDRLLRIFLDPQIVEDLFPDSTDSFWTTAPVSGLGGARLRAGLVTRARTSMTTALTNIFVTDAGFTGGRAVFLDDPVDPTDTTVRTAYGRSSRPITIPYFTYFIERVTSLGSVAHAEEIEIPTTPTTYNGFDWLLHSVFPQGSGDKSMRRGVQFKSTYFGDHLPTFVSERHAAASRRRSPGPAVTAAHIQDFAEKRAAKVAEVIAHEVGHSLGLMHECECHPSASANFEESGVGPLRSIMCSLTESNPYGAGVFFSHQAKLIWKDAFGLSPALPNNSLVNKTWSGTEWQTVDWTDRRNRMMHIMGETGMSRYPVDANQVSPYTTMPSPQPGTYVPPTP